jgi:Tfp pilus assembly protein PilX
MRENFKQQGYILLLVPVILVGISVLLMRSMNRSRVTMRISGAELNHLQTGLCAQQCAAVAVNTSKWKMDNNQSVLADTESCSCNPSNQEDVACKTVFTPRIDSNFSNCYGTVVNKTNLDIQTSCSQQQQDAQTILENVDFSEIPIFQFAAFFEKQLEISNGPQMDIAGRVHSNDVVLLKPNGGPVNLYDWVTAVNEVQVARFKDILGHTASSSDVGFPKASGGVDAAEDWNSSTTPKALNTVPAMSDWKGWQKTHKVAYGSYSGICGKVARLNVPLRDQENPHALIEWRDSPVKDDYGDKRQKLAWRADLVYKGRGGKPANTNPTDATSGWKNGDAGLSTAFLAIDPVKRPIPAWVKPDAKSPYRVRFWDQRDTLWVRPVPIDLAVLVAQRPTDSVIYLYDSKIDATESPKDAGGFLIYNAKKLMRPLTIVSNTRVYLKGSFNVDSAYMVSGKRRPWPAAIICDGLTQLSDEWDGTLFTDTQVPIYGAKVTAGNPNARCVLNACVMTGTGELNGTWVGQGGYHNLIRFMEDWGGAPFEFSGAGACLWSSKVSTGRWYGDGPNALYKAPSRDFAFDPMFKKMANMPPATPRLVKPWLNNWEMARK